jgi:hypothetical protein
MEGFCRSVVDDDDKTVNPAHIIAFLFTFASIGWITYLVIKNGAMPDLSGLAILIGGGSGAINLVHKAGDLVDRFRSNGHGNPVSKPAEGDPGGPR